MSKNKNLKASIALNDVLLIVAISLIGMGVYYYSLGKSRIENRRKEAQTELIKLKSIIEQQAVGGAFQKTDGTSVAVNSAVDVAKILQTDTATTPITTINKYYNIIVTLAPMPPGGYILTAAPALNSPQIKDIDSCQSIVLTVSMDGSYIKTPPDCWK